MLKFLRKTLLLLTLTLASISGSCQIISVDPPSALAELNLSAHHIHIESLASNATCSSIAVGPRTLLTAAHCVIGSGKVMIDDAEHVGTIDKIVYDEADHALLEFKDVTFSSFKKIEEREIHIGEPVRIWGWPGRSSQPLYREGVCTDSEASDNGNDPTMYSFRIPVFPGDSGSGIVAADGNVISVVSLGDQSANMYAFALRFTPEQLSTID